jgi:predicted metal-dependent hydrolase
MLASRGRSGNRVHDFERSPRRANWRSSRSVLWERAHFAWDAARSSQRVDVQLELVRYWRSD